MKQNLIFGLLIGILIGLVAGRFVRPVGRYQLQAQHGGFHVIDTTTGQVWGRANRMIIDFGTPQKPKGEQIKIDE